jgi:hypothetical protein
VSLLGKGEAAMLEERVTHRPDLSSERGGALIVALMVFVMLAIMGTVMVSMIRNGLTHAATVEADHQAELYAQQGLDEALVLIRTAVEAGNAGASTYRSRIDAVSDRLSDLKSTYHSGVLINSSDGQGQYKLKLEFSTPTVPGVYSTPPNPDDPYVQKITVTSIGSTRLHGSRSASKKMILYVNTIHPVFRFPVSTEGGNLNVFGAARIVGDVAIRGGKLRTSSEARFVGGVDSDYRVESVLPDIQGFVRVEEAASDPVRYEKLTHHGATISPSNQLKRDFFTVAPFEDKRMRLPDPLAIPSAYVDPKMNLSSLSTNKIEMNPPADGMTYKLGSLHGTNKLTASTKYVNQWIEIDGLLEVPGSPLAPGNLVVENGTLRLGSPATTGTADEGKLTLRQGSLYVKFTDDPNLAAAELNGKLELDAGHYAAIEGNAILRKFSYEGSMYVRGDVQIIGDLDMQGTLYVDGNVDLKQMRSINRTGGKPLIIAASGHIILSDNENPGASDEAQEIRAFLYSGGVLDLYGVLSKLKIYGGIHGSEITLNAVKGSAGKTPAIGLTNTLNYKAEPSTDTLDLIGDYYFTEDQAGTGTYASEDDKPQSRLQIYFDPQLYSDPPEGIPVVDQAGVFVQQISFQ